MEGPTRGTGNQTSEKGLALSYMRTPILTEEISPAERRMELGGTDGLMGMSSLAIGSWARSKVLGSGVVRKGRAMKETGLMGKLMAKGRISGPMEINTPGTGRTVSSMGKERTLSRMVKSIRVSTSEENLMVKVFINGSMDAHIKESSKMD